jgi:hypothetical protein
LSCERARQTLKLVAVFIQIGLAPTTHRVLTTSIQ